MLYTNDSCVVLSTDGYNLYTPTLAPNYPRNWVAAWEPQLTDSADNQGSGQK